MVAIADAEKLTSEIRDAVLAALDEPCPPPQQQALVDRIAGRSYTREEKLELLKKSLTEGFIARHKLLEDCISGTEVRKLLNSSSRMTPINRINNGTLLAAKEGGVWKFPIWQFDPQGEDSIVEGLAETIKALDISDIAKISWFITPNSHFQGNTPLEMLKSGNIEETVNEARGVGFS